MKYIFFIGLDLLFYPFLLLLYIGKASYAKACRWARGLH